MIYIWNVWHWNIHCKHDTGYTISDAIFFTHRGPPAILASRITTILLSPSFEILRRPAHDFSVAFFSILKSLINSTNRMFSRSWSTVMTTLKFISCTSLAKARGVQVDNFRLSLNSVLHMWVSYYVLFFLQKEKKRCSTQAGLMGHYFGARNGATFERSDTPFLPSFFSLLSP